MQHRDLLAVLAVLREFVRISANVTDDFGNVTGCGGRCWVASI
jgi:hypothetical protein